MINVKDIAYLFSCSKHPKNINTTVNYGDYASMEGDCVGTPEKFASPQEALKHAMQSLKQDEWKSNIAALIKLMHISRSQPELLDSNMSRIYRTLCRSFEHLHCISCTHCTFLLYICSLQCNIIFAVYCEIRDHMSLELFVK